MMVPPTKRATWSQITCATDQLQFVARPHRGAAAACNHGIRLARGKFIAIQGSDDEWFPQKLERGINALEHASAKTAVFYSDMMRVHANGEFFHAHAPEVRRGQLLNDATLDFSVVGIGSNSAIMKRSCLDEVGLFDENLRRFIDLELFLRLLAKFDFVQAKESLVRWHLAEGMTTDTKARVHARHYLLRKYRALFRNNRPALAGQYIQLALAYAAHHNTAQTYRFALQALLICPQDARVRTAASEILRGRSRSDA